MDKGKKAPSTFFFAILFTRRFKMREKKNNIMRTPKEKEQIVLESDQFGVTKTAKKYDVDKRLLRRWRIKYHNHGVDGLISKTGMSPKPGNGLKGLHVKKNKTREEELELENLKLKVENARLKKGYQVKGVGSTKEYVTIKDLNTKS